MLIIIKKFVNLQNDNIFLISSFNFTCLQAVSYSVSNRTLCLQSIRKSQNQTYRMY